jgi:hypothetical protein
MKQFIITLIGLLSIVVFICGIVCGIQAIVAGSGFTTVSSVIFMIVWVYLAIDWFRGDGPEMLYKQFFDK